MTPCTVSAAFAVLHRMVPALLLAALLPFATWAADNTPAGVDQFARIAALAQDNPRAALTAVETAMAAKSDDGDGAFWNLLALTHVRSALEQPAEARHALSQAEAALARLKSPSETHRHALRLLTLWSSALETDPAAIRADVDALAAELRQHGPLRLACDVISLRGWVYQETTHLDDAWRMSQELEQCAQTLGDVVLQAGARVRMGILASAATERRGDDRAAAMHFQRALDVLGDHPARYLRSIIEWEMGKAAGRDPAQQRHHFTRARELSTSIGDEVGVAVATVDLAKVALGMHKPREALQMARESRAIFRRHGVQARMPATYAIAIGAMTQLRDPAVLGEIEQARQFDSAIASPTVRAGLARLMAEAYASVDQYRQAYEEMLRYTQLDTEGRDNVANQTVLKLQAAFDAAQRDAENARLRLRDESARLELDAAQARQQRMLAALIATAVAALALGSWVAAALRQRQRLADLASRDDLTGAPNRRAILAIAQSQWNHARRLKMPMSIALIDLDHFKRVNDTWGHDAGDRVLKAFAHAAAGTLRSQDRLGRYGGEEWLLVAPGTGPVELQAMFGRLRERLAVTPIDGLPMPHGLSFSMGGAPDHPGCPNLAALITEADRRLYRAKAAGRDRICVDDVPQHGA